MLIKRSTEDKNHNPILHFTLVTFPYLVFLSSCTSGAGLQSLLFIDNYHLGSIHCFQRYSCFKLLWYAFWKVMKL